MADSQEFLRGHLDEQGRIAWPEEAEARAKLAQALFGLGFVSSMDYWIDLAQDRLNNPQPAKPYARPWNEFAKTDRAYRETFATLSDDQRNMVAKLVRHVVSGALYSSLVEIDQFPHGRIVIDLVNDPEDPNTFRVPVAPSEADLHRCFHEWKRDFSRYPEHE